MTPTPKAPSSFPPRETSEEEIRARLKRTYPSSYHHDSFSVRCVIELICWERDNYPHQSLLSAEREAGRAEVYKKLIGMVEQRFHPVSDTGISILMLIRDAMSTEESAAPAPAAGKERG